MEEALSLLQTHGFDAKLLAGGHSLLPAMKLGLDAPGVLVDIGRLPELQGIKEEAGHLVIGAGVTHGAIAKSDLVHAKLPVLAEAAELIGDVQVRNKGTLGGSLAHNDPAADWPAVMLATEAQIQVVGPDGKRSIAAEDFFVDFYTTALEEGELITAIRIPISPANTGASYKKFMQPASRFAVVGCAAVITKEGGNCSAVRVAFTGVNAAAFRAKGIEAALKGKACTAENIAAAVEKGMSEVEASGDDFVSAEYRKHLAGVFARRALAAAGA